MTSLFDDLLTEEQILFRDSVRGFAERHLADGRLARAHERSFPFDVARLMAGQGLLGMTFPEADGGAGGSLMDAILAIEAVAARSEEPTSELQSLLRISSAVFYLKT